MALRNRKILLQLLTILISLTHESNGQRKSIDGKTDHVDVDNMIDIHRTDHTEMPEVPAVDKSLPLIEAPRIFDVDNKEPGLRRIDPEMDTEGGGGGGGGEGEGEEANIGETISRPQSLQQKAFLDKLGKNRTASKSFHKEPCGMDAHCFDIYSNGLECRDEACECRVWRGTPLAWKEERLTCVSTRGHPCVNDKMCASDKCDKDTLTCSRGASIIIVLWGLQSPNILIRLLPFMPLILNVIPNNK